MIDQVFGFYTVLSDSGRRAKNRQIMWLCECKCGKKAFVRSDSLKNKKNSRSCGCNMRLKGRARFDSQYEKTEGCWIWKGKENTGGYGKWANTSASRQSWIYNIGKIPKGRQVCHTCDNRKCVNPSHLFLGSIGDNMRDKISKNRQAKGSKIGSSILSEQMVLDMRRMRIDGHNYETIAKTFSVSWWLTRCICKNRQWKHVALGEESSSVKRKYR